MESCGFWRVQINSMYTRRTLGQFHLYHICSQFCLIYRLLLNVVFCTEILAVI